MSGASGPSRPTGPTGSTVGSIAALLEDWYPPELAEDWDVIGLTVGAPDQPVRGIRLAVEPTAEVIAETAESGADLLITHHPLLLRGVDRIRYDTPKGAAIRALVRHDIALYVAHTNADAAVGGVVECLVAAVGLGPGRPLEPAAGRPELGLGRVVDLSEPLPLRVFAERVGRALPATAAGIRVGGSLDRPVRRVAVLAGAGDSLLDVAREVGADVYVTSDLRHHPAGDALAWTDGPALIDIPHWAAEWLWLPELARRLTAEVAVPVEVSGLVTDPWTLHLP